MRRLFRFGANAVCVVSSRNNKPHVHYSDACPVPEGGTRRKFQWLLEHLLGGMDQNGFS
jgi:hypothetical protein